VCQFLFFLRSLIYILLKRANKRAATVETKREDGVIENAPESLGLWLWLWVWWWGEWVGGRSLWISEGESDKDCNRSDSDEDSDKDCNLIDSDGVGAAAVICTNNTLTIKAIIKT